MALDPGTHLGPYEILSQLGAGGMGEVYRARDPRLGRDVAIKVSAEQFNERFEREAKVVASLNHPEYLRAVRRRAELLVMELVEGESPKGPMPLEEALANLPADRRCARSRARKRHRPSRSETGEYQGHPDGHREGSGFRPGEDRLGMPGSGNPEESPTISMHATQAGMILGTAGYMAPEQAKGKSADKRADIWAFGVVLYEMLTGKRLFMGETVTDTLAAVVLGEPKLADAPSQVQRLLKRCLEKDPQKRLRDIGDAMSLLEEAPAQSSAPVMATAPPSRSGTLGMGCGGGGGAGRGSPAFIHFRETPPVAETVRFKTALPDEGELHAYGHLGSLSGWPQTALFRGGRRRRSARVDPIDGFARSSASAGLGNSGDSGDALSSPDSRFVGFQSEGKLKKIDIAGGPAVALCDTTGNVNGGSWNRDGVILFVQGSQVRRVSASGGTSSPVTVTAKGEGHAFSAFLPDGQHFLYDLFSQNPDTSGVYVGALDTKPEQQSTQRLMPGGFQPVYVPAGNSGSSGYILFLNAQGTLMAQPFDAGRLRLAGEPVPIAEQVASFQGLGHYSASENGVLAYRTGASEGLELQPSWFDRQGKSTLTPVEPSRSSTLKVSPDGKRAAVVRSDPKSNSTDIWVLDLSTGASDRFTFDPANDGNPLWSPDGSQIVWQSNRGGTWGIYRKASNGSGSDDLVYKFPTQAGLNLTDWSRDGRFIIFQAPSPQTKSDVYALPMGPGTNADRQPIPVIQTPAVEFGAYLSPDDRWIAYLSDESGKQELYVQAFGLGAKPGAPPPSGKWMVSKNGSAGMARWRNDGKELVFIGADGGVMSVDVTADPVFHASQPKLLFQLPHSVLAMTTTPGAMSDATRDLQRFLITVPAQSNVRPEFTVVLNWRAALKH